MQHFHGFREQIAGWTFDDSRESLKILLEYCLNQHGRIRSVRSLQGHSGGVDTKLQNNVIILYGWTHFI